MRNIVSGGRNNIQLIKRGKNKDRLDGKRESDFLKQECFLGKFTKVFFLGMFSINSKLTPFNYAVESWTISDSVFPKKSSPCAGQASPGWS